MVCPHCGGSNIHRALSFPKHVYRVLTGDHKRVCLDCHAKWMTAGSFLTNIAENPAAVLIGLCLLISLLAMILLNMSFDPEKFLKTKVRQRYDQKYGKDSGGKLWSDWGGVYGSRGSAQDDYYRHPKN